LAKDLELQNASLHPGLCIKRLSWPRGIQKTRKLNSSLTVFLTSPEMANRVIEQRLVESREVKMVERFQTGCGLVQCFKCCVYRHIAKHCWAEARCGHCSGFHETRNCTNNKEKTMYMNCTGRELGFKDYKAWSESCPVCKKVREDLAVRFCNRPTTYPQAVCLDHCPVVSLVVEKEPEKQRPGRSKGSVNRVPRAGASQTLQRDAIEVDSGPSKPPAKRPRQATLSFGVTEG
jgi:hypothetical protein